MSARLTKVGRGERLTIANVGVEEVEVLRVDVDPHDVLVSGGPDISGTALDPGEDFGLIVGLTLGTPFAADRKNAVGRQPG